MAWALAQIVTVVPSPESEQQKQTEMYLNYYGEDLVHYVLHAKYL